MNKRGISNIVSVLLIVLLVIVAVGIVWAAVSGLLKESRDDIDIDQFIIDLEITSAVKSGETVNVTVQRMPGRGDLKSVKFIFSDGTNDKTADEEVSLEEYEGETFSFDLGSLEVPNAYKVSIAPVYETSSGSEKIGTVVDSYEFSASPNSQDDGGEDTGGGEECTVDTDCSVGYECTGGSCVLQEEDECTVDTDCSVGYECTGGSCVPQEGGEDAECTVDENCSAGFKCVNESCTSACNETWEQDYYAEGIYECDGDVNGCSGSCICETGFTNDGLGGCSIDDPIFTGTVFSVWPDEGSAMLFQTNNLPKDNEVLQSNYSLLGSYYINFSNSGETDCFGIDKAVYYEDVDRVEVSLNILPLAGMDMANITGGDREQFSIWEAQMCGNSTL